MPMDSADDASGQVGDENIFAKDYEEANVNMGSSENTSGQFQKTSSGKNEKPIEDFTSGSTSGQVGNENNFAKDSDEANVIMDSTENTSGQFQKTFNGIEDLRNGSFCNSENIIHTPIDDEAQSLKHVKAVPECISSGRNKKRGLPIDGNEVEEHDAEEGKRPTAKKSKIDDQSECMAAEDEIMEERNEYMQNIGEELQYSAQDHDNEFKRGDVEGEEKSTAMSNRTDNESGYMAVEDVIMEEKNEFMQSIDEQSLHLAEDHNNEAKEDAEEEQNSTTKEYGTDNQSRYMAAEDEIMEERNEFMQNSGEESQHSAGDHDNEVKRDNAEEHRKLTAMENRIADESGYMTAEDEIMEEENECIEITDEESLHSAEDQEEATSIADYDENEDDRKDEDGLDYDKVGDDLEKEGDDRGEDEHERSEVIYNILQPFNEVGMLDPLTNKEEFIAKLVLSNKYSNEVLVEHPNIDEDITGKLLECLRPEHQLNNGLVDVYLQLLKEREQNNPNKFLKCHFFNSFFYESLARVYKTGDLESIMRKTEKLEYQLIDCDKIFVPIYDSGAHWVVTTIDIKRKRIEYLNSISSGLNHQAISIIAWYIKAEAKQRNGIDLDTDLWEKEAPENIPSQENENDAGVFMLKYIDYISRDLLPDFNQEDIPLLRKKMLIEILNIPGASRKIDLGWQCGDENTTGNSNKLPIEGLLDSLNEAQEVMVQCALGTKNRDVVLIKHPNISESITGGLLQCLKPNRWLSSDVSRIKKAIEKIQTVYYDTFISIFV